MKLARLGQLKETDLQIDGSTPQGKALLSAFKNFFAQVNPYFDSINRLFAKGISLTDNIRAEIVSGTFSHGIAQLVRLKVLERASGAVVLGANGKVAAGASITMLQSSAGQLSPPPLANLTVYFTDPAAVNVQTSILLLPEGQQTAG